MHDAQKVRFWVAAAVVTAINCSLWLVFMFVNPSGGETVRLSWSTSASRFAETGIYQMRFDRDLIADHDIGQAMEPPFTFDPAIEGKWYASKRNVLLFKPHGPPLPGRIYTLHPVDDHRLHRTFTIGADTLPVLRYKPLDLIYARLTSSTPIALEGGDLGRRSTVEFRFNQPVSADALEQHLEVKQGDALLKGTWKTLALGDMHQLQIDSAPGAALDLQIDGTLTGHGGELSLPDTSRHRIRVPRDLTALHLDTDAFRWWSRDPTVVLHFDRSLAANQTSPKVVFTPEVASLSAVISGKRLVLKGDFTPGADYALTIEPPLLARDGTTITAPITRRLRIPKGRARLSLPRRTGRLGTQGAFTLDLEARGVRKATVQIHKLLERHVPIYLSGVMSWWQVPRLSELIAESTIDIDPDGLGAVRHLALELDTLMPRTPGVYALRIEGEEVRWTSDDMLLFVGDLGLEVQTDATGMLAWVTNVYTGKPVEGADVTAWATDRTELSQQVTDASGLVRFNMEPGLCDLLTAVHDGHLIFVDPRDAKAIDDRALAGARWSGPLDIALYADRGVHRPGEVLHCSGIVRTRTGELPGEIPLEVRFTRPDKRVIATREVLVSADQGVFHLDLQTAEDAPTGNWRLSVHVPGDDEAIEAIACPVMPVLPVRLKVEAIGTVDTDGVPHVDVRSTYLHGAPAVALPTTVSTVFTAQRYTDDRYVDFRFEEPPTKERIKHTTKGVLDDDGHARLAVQGPALPGVWRGRVEATVLELGGRGTTSRTRIDLDTAKAHLGLRIVGGELHRPADPIGVEAVKLNAHGSPVLQEPLTGRLERIDHEWQLVDEGRTRRWRSIEIVQPMLNVEPIFTIQGDGYSCTIPPLLEGTYRLTATLADADSGEELLHTSVPLHVSDTAARGRMSADQPDRLELIPEHAVVEPGMKTSVLLRSAFPGLALVTVETDEILSSQLIEVTGDGARVNLQVPADVRDTCFVGATLIRPLDPKRPQWLPLRARGAVRLSVDRSPYLVDIALQAQDRARPGDVVQVVVEVTQVPDKTTPDPVVVAIQDPTVEATLDPAIETTQALPVEPTPAHRPRPNVHLWAVEEGALLLTDYHVPSLVDHFLRDRRRVVAGAATAEDLLADYERPETIDRIGSDIARQFRAPVPIRRPEIEVLWHRVVQLPKDGHLTMTLTMPEIDGAMRVMAVLIDGDRFGRAEHGIAVTAPLQIEATVPRAAAPGDSMTIPMRVRNNGAAPVQLTLALEHDAALDGSVHPVHLTIPPGGTGLAQLKLTATGVGSAEVHVHAIADTGDEARFDRTIAIRPPHGRTREIVRMQVKSGETVPIERRRDLDALAGRIELVVGGLPSVDLAPVFAALVDYPWGCAEQVGSRTQGLLAGLRLPQAVTGVDQTTLRILAASGLERLWAMQRPEGSMPYWRGGSGEYWLTLRTALLALAAREAGVDLPDRFIEGLLQFTRSKARTAREQHADGIAALACRVLARAGEEDLALMEALASHDDALNGTARAHLADAFATVGNLQQASALLADSALPSPGERQAGGMFESDIHEAAVLLDVLLRNNMEHPLTPELVRMLNTRRNANGWRTTYENAAAIDALSRWHAMHTDTGIARGTIEIAGHTVAFDGNTPVRHVFDVTASAADVIERLHSTGDGPVTVLIATSGIPLQGDDGGPVEDRIIINRRWLDAAGAVIEPGTTILAGDLVTVELEIRTAQGATWPNTALVEVLPGGMEFELPSLATSAGRDEVKLNEVDRVDFMDDRLVAFLTVSPKTKRLRYVVRAVVPGRWAVPAPDALAMYDPDAHGRGRGGEVQIDLEGETP